MRRILGNAEAHWRQAHLHIFTSLSYEVLVMRKDLVMRKVLVIQEVFL